MLYCISDIHGELDLFIKLLKKINFNKNDQLIILGDIIDKGTKSIELSELIFSMENVKVLMGNHEYEFYKYYQALKQQNKLDILKLQSFFPEEEKKLDNNIINHLINLPFYFETNDVIFVHAGVLLDCNNNIVDLDKTPNEYFVYDREFKNDYVIYNSNKCVIFGHTPTCYTNNNFNIIKYKRANSLNKSDIKNYYKIHIDTGVYLTNVLGCICLDTMEEFYVDKFS